MTAVFGTIAVLALLSTGTLAYFTTQAEVENSITTGAVSLAVRQRDTDGKEITGETAGIMPGDTVEYTAAVENTGEEPVYLRVKLIKDVKGAPESGLNVEECLKVEINETDWTLREEASGEVYYYYNKALPGGEETEPLFTEVRFDGTVMDNEYLGKNLVLHVAAYGVQSANNAGNALDALGWPEEADAEE